MPRGYAFVTFQLAFLACFFAAVFLAAFFAVFLAGFFLALCASSSPSSSEAGFSPRAVLAASTLRCRAASRSTTSHEDFLAVGACLT